MCYYVVAALYLIVKKYRKQITLLTYLSQEQNIFELFLLQEYNKKYATFVYKKLLTTQCCVKFYAFSISGMVYMLRGQTGLGIIYS